MKALAAALAAGALLLGLLAGYLMWGLKSRDLEGELRALQGRETAERQRANELQSRMSESETRVKQLTDDLTAERDLRHKYERLIGQGRK